MEDLAATIFSGVCANMPLRYLDTNTLEEMAVVSVMGAYAIKECSSMPLEELEKLMAAIQGKYGKMTDYPSNEKK